MVEGPVLLHVQEPGFLTTVQDLGRFGWQRYGFSVTGAADPTALVWANRLVGNPPDSAALEITLLGPRIAFQGEAVIALTGADLGAQLNGNPAPPGISFLVRSGDVLTFLGGKRGCRSYLAVAGGVAVPTVLDSCSTDLLAGFGGYRGRPLQAGDIIPVGEVGEPLARRADRRTDWTFVPEELTARALPGPHAPEFDRESLAAFFRSDFRVDPRSNRVGVRLQGPALSRDGGEILSEGQPLGGVQVPGDGQPIVLMVDRATVGGYPKVAVVITPDISILAQARPGDTIRFQQVNLTEARALYRDWHQRLYGEH